MLLHRRALVFCSAIAALALTTSRAYAIDTSTPDGLIRELSAQTLAAVKADKDIQAGNIAKIQAFVEAQIMPHVNFQRITASSVGKYWRQATDAQKAQLQVEYRGLLVRTYAGALSQIRDQQIGLKPFRGAPSDTEVVVQTVVKGRGEPLQLDYRLEKVGPDWKIYDVNVMGIWLGDQYRNSFSQEIGANGIDGLIQKLAEKNGKAKP